MSHGTKNMLEMNKSTQKISYVYLIGFNTWTNTKTTVMVRMVVGNNRDNFKEKPGSLFSDHS